MDPFTPKSYRPRLRKDLRRLWLDPPAFCRPGASPVKDLHHWEVVIDGPTGSPYAGGTFPVDLRFPDEYPLKPPRITFKTKVYHPNIDSEGAMVLDIFKPGEWRASLTIDKVLLSIVSVLYDPLLDYPINGDAADVYESDVELYKEAAMAWTWEYSSTPIVSHYPSKEGEEWLDHCDKIAAQAAAEKAEAERLSAAEERLRRRKEEEDRAAAPGHGRKKVASPLEGGVISRFWKSRGLLICWLWVALVLCLTIYCRNTVENY